MDVVKLSPSQDTLLDMDMSEEEQNIFILHALKKMPRQKLFHMLIEWAVVDVLAEQIEKFNKVEEKTKKASKKVTKKISKKGTKNAL